MKRNLSKDVSPKRPDLIEETTPFSVGRAQSSDADEVLQEPRGFRLSTGLKKGKLKVYMGLNVVSVFEVDTVHELFKVRLNVRQIWPASNEPFVSGLSSFDDIMHLVQGMNDADTDWLPKWWPRSGIRNQIETSEVVENFVSVLVNRACPETEDQWRAAIESKSITRNDFWVMHQKAMNVTVNHSEQLQNFPFDLQELKIIVRMDHSSMQVEVDPMEHMPEDVRRSFPESVCIPTATLTVNFENLSTAERMVWSRVPCAYKVSNDVINRAHGFTCGTLQLSIFVERHLGHYIYNVFLMVSLITSLTILSWSMRPEEIQDRLALDATLLLTGQAFKLVISDKLPKVNYLTHIDMYIFNCFMFILLGMILHAAAGWQGEVNEELDDFCRWIWAGSWVFANALFIVVVVCRRMHTNSTMKKHIHEEKFEVCKESEVGLRRKLRMTGKVHDAVDRQLSLLEPVVERFHRRASSPNVSMEKE